MPPHSRCTWFRTPPRSAGLIGRTARRRLREGGESENSVSAWVEPLESRVVPADLSGSMALLTSVATRGGQVSVQFNVSNSDFDTIFTAFNVSFFLSKDTVISFDDPLLHTETLPPGFPGFFTTLTQFRTFNLPGASDPYWGPGTSYHVIMLVDAFNQVFEWSEFNNVAGAPLTVNGGGGGGGGGGFVTELDSLPATGHSPGIVLNELLIAFQAHLKSLSKDYARIAKAGKNLIDISPLLDDLKRLQSQTGGLRSLLNPLINGKTASLPIGGGKSLTAADLEKVDRGIIHLLTNPLFHSTNTGSLDVLDEAAVVDAAFAASADDPDINFLNKIRADIKKTWVDAGVKAFETTANLFKQASSFVPVIGEALAAASTLATAIGRSLKFGAAKIFEGDRETFIKHGAPENTNLRKEFVKEAVKEIVDQFSPPTPPWQGMIEFAQTIESINNNAEQANDQIEAQFDALFDRLSGNKPGPGPDPEPGFSRKWNGNLQYDQGGVDIGGPMSISLQRGGSDGSLNGKMTLTFTVYDENFNVINRDKSRADFSLFQTGNGTYGGNVDVKTPLGQTINVPVTVQIAGGQMFGTFGNGNFQLQSK